MNRIYKKYIRHKIFVLHPFLFTLFPIVSLYAGNVEQVRLEHIVRPILLSLGGVGLFMVLMWLLLRSWHKAGLAASLASLAFFTYGHVFRLLEDPLGGQSAPLLVLWVVLFAAALWGIARRLPALPVGFTRLVNGVAALALATCLHGFVLYGVRTVQASELISADTTPEPILPLTGPPTEVPLPAGSTVTPAQPPDIYYIILDGYARDDVLEELYGLDNSPFLDYLREKGFYIAEESYSNYPQTALSLASSLNFTYIHDRLELEPSALSRKPLTDMINDNDLQRFLKENGYRTVAFTNGFPATELFAADDFLSPDQGLSNFEISLLSGSLGGIELTEKMQEDYRAKVLWAADEMTRVVESEGPKFVFAHFILPHPPFVFTSSGAPRPSLSGGDGSHFSGTREEYQEGYREQLLYANILAEGMIEAILSHPSREPVIILQGDHGPGSLLDWESMETSCLHERLAVLNAYYLPGQDNEALYPEISPVNTFRVVLNAYFGTELDLLDDRSFFALWGLPYDQVEVTGEIEDRCPLPPPED